MKKIIIAFSLFLLANSTSYAQDTTSYKSALSKMMTISGAEKSYKGIIDQMIILFKQQQTSVPEEFWNEFSIEMHKNAFDDIVNMVLPVYQKHLTENDIKGIIAFYETPLGKKYAEKTPLITQESMQAGQEWGRKLGETVVQKLKDKGYL